MHKIQDWLFGLFDAKQDLLEVRLGAFGFYVLRWAVSYVVVVGIGTVAWLVARKFTKSGESPMEWAMYVRSVLAFSVAWFIVYATYHNVAYRNRKKHKEDEAMYKEIAAYYREQKHKRESAHE